MTLFTSHSSQGTGSQGLLGCGISHVIQVKISRLPHRQSIRRVRHSGENVPSSIPARILKHYFCDCKAGYKSIYSLKISGSTGLELSGDWCRCQSWCGCAFTSSSCYILLKRAFLEIREACGFAGNLESGA